MSINGNLVRNIIASYLIVSLGHLYLAAEVSSQSVEAKSQSVKEAAKVPSNDSELEEAITLFQKGIQTLDRAYADLPYTVLAEKKKAYLTEWHGQVQAYTFAGLNQQSKVDYILLVRNLKREEEELAQQQKLWESMKPALPFAPQLLELGWMRHEGKTPDAAKIAQVLNQVGQQIEHTQVNLSKINLKAVSSLPQAMHMAKSVRKTLKGVFEFYNGYHPDFTWWVNKPYRRTDSLFSVYIDTLGAHLSRQLQSNDGSGIVGAPIGKARVEQSLQQEFIPYSTEELIEIAQQEYAWCLKEMKKASAEMGYKDDWKQALEKVKNDYVPVGEQPALISTLAKEALAYVEGHDLISVPALAKETWTMEMMSPERQRVNPFFLGGNTIIISYPTQTMAYEDQLMSLRGNNKHFAKATVFHELIPGHYLQEFMLERYKSYRNPFYTPFWEEGWAFYWEMLLWDQGFHASPEDRVGALFWRMHRCARIIFSLNFHMGKWTPKQCVDFLISQVGHERANAEGEVRRSFAGDYGPLYQVAYMIGALQFRALHRELVDSGKMTNKDFHHQVLTQYAMPIEMVRALLTNAELTQAYKPNWKFYGHIKTP